MLVNKLTVMECELCNGAGGLLLWGDDFCRVVLIDDKDYSGFCRVILNRHIKEMTDLNATERARLMHTVFAVETVVRESAAPDKINLACLGNVVPHLHWHVIPRWRDDRNFPDPIWAAPRRSAAPRPPADAPALTRRLQQLLAS